MARAERDQSPRTPGAWRLVIVRDGVALCAPGGGPPQRGGVSHPEHNRDTTGADQRSAIDRKSLKELVGPPGLEPGTKGL